MIKECVSAISRRLDEHFSGIENTVGVKKLLDRLHYVKRRIIDRHPQIRRLHIADTVFTADRTSQFDRESEGVTNSFPGATDRIRIFPVAQEVDVDVAVAGVAKVRDKRPVPLADLVDFPDQLRNL